MCLLFMVSPLLRANGIIPALCGRKKPIARFSFFLIEFCLNYENLIVSILYFIALK